MFFSLDNF